MNVTASRPINLIVIHCTASRCDRGHNARSIDIAYKGGLLPDGTPANTRTAARRGALLRLLRQLLGSFRVAISTEGVEVAEKFTAANIKKARIVFTPCKELKNLCKTFEIPQDFSAVKAVLTKEKTTPPEAVAMMATRTRTRWAKRPFSAQETLENVPVIFHFAGAFFYFLP